jgi:hypothetical protein
VHALARPVLERALAVGAFVPQCCACAPARLSVCLRVRIRRLRLRSSALAGVCDTAYACAESACRRLASSCSSSRARAPLHRSRWRRSTRTSSERSAGRSARRMQHVTCTTHSMQQHAAYNMQRATWQRAAAVADCEQFQRTTAASSSSTGTVTPSLPMSSVQHEAACSMPPYWSDGGMSAMHAVARHAVEAASSTLRDVRCMPRRMLYGSRFYAARCTDARCTWTTSRPCTLSVRKPSSARAAALTCGWMSCLRRFGTAQIRSSTRAACSTIPTGVRSGAT